jgi:hydroxymethylpyrimidine pyrophosphatase-like HAD family hydrolase
MEYVRETFGADVDRTVACGDSGNDLMMLEGACKAIVVGNAQPALMDWATDAVRRERDGGRVFIAKETTARGILEGLESFGFLTR